MVPLPQTDSAKAMHPTTLANDTTSQMDRERCLQACREGDLPAGLAMQPQMLEVAIGYGRGQGVGRATVITVTQTLEIRESDQELR